MLVVYQRKIVICMLETIVKQVNNGQLSYQIIAFCKYQQWPPTMVKLDLTKSNETDRFLYLGCQKFESVVECQEVLPNECVFLLDLLYQVNLRV